MRLYYGDDNVRLWHGDALDVLPTIPAGSVHAVITDPPYILQAGSSYVTDGKTGGWSDMMNAAHWYAAWYREAARVLRSDGGMWTFGNWRTLPVMQRAAIDAQLPATSLLVWDKIWIGPAGPRALRSQHEFVMVLAKPEYRIVDRSQGDVLRVQASPHKPSGHPAEKPLPLMTRIVELAMGNVKNGTVVDPFAGSGTTLVAAVQAGHHAVGIEDEERYCKLAARRVGGVLPTLSSDGEQLIDQSLW